MPTMTTLSKEEAARELGGAVGRNNGYAQADGTIHLIDLDLIDPNPWQPRTYIDPQEVEDLAENIDAIDLLQEPLLRPVGDRFQAAFGHKRIAALHLLAARGRREKVAPSKLAELTDEQMAYIALSENSKRSDISPAETLRAWEKALEIPSVTITELAAKVGIDRTTMSKDLLVLHLPDEALELIHKGVHQGGMSVRAARELLALRTADHIHEDMVKAVLIDCGSEQKYGDGPPSDYRTKTVRASIMGLASNRPERYLGLLDRQPRPPVEAAGGGRHQGPRPQVRRRGVQARVSKSRPHPAGGRALRRYRVHLQRPGVAAAADGGGQGAERRQPAQATR